MTIELLDHYPVELDDFAAESAASFYQTSAWITSLDVAFPRMSARCLVARRGGVVAGYMPFFVIRRGPVSFLQSMPFGTYGGPVTDGDRSVAESLVEAYQRLGSGIGVLELSWTDFWNRPASGRESLERHSTRLIDLSEGFESIWRNRFEKAKRRQVRKAEREGLAVVDGGLGRDLEVYYAIYRERIAEWGDPFSYPRRFFEALLSSAGRRARLFLVKKDGETLGGHLNLYFGDTVIAWNGVTRSDTGGLQASTFLYAHLIRHACDEGFGRYNLGSSLGKISLEQYKAALGGESYTYVHHRLVSRAGRLARRCRALLSRNR